MPLIVVMRDVQGQGYSAATLQLPMKIRAVLLRCFPWVVTLSLEKLPGGKVPMFPIYAADIMEDRAWHKVVEPHLKLAL
jgi:hypothetical protein